MNTPTIRLRHRQPDLADTKPLRHRAIEPAIRTNARVLFTVSAAHDFLVANPRPDLTTDLRTLRMIEVR
jgi:hypothetical protein